MKIIDMRVSILLMIVLTGLHFGAHATSLQKSADQSQATQYIEMLKSDDDAKRIEGKEKLIQLGDSAIAALLPLLEDLVKQQHKFWPYPEDKEEREKLKRQLDRGRLFRKDVMELLGRLHAREAIPLLIDSVDQRGLRIKNLIIFNSFEISPEMAALIEIGTPAVPQILHTIEGAEAEAKRETEAVAATRTESLVTIDGEVAQKTKFPVTIDGEVATITQIRLAMVLGEIGDVRALPVLEDLEKQRARKITTQVQQAITKIKAKNNLK